MKAEFKKRRTVLSSLLAVLEDPTYNFQLERDIGQIPPSNDETLEILAKIVDASDSPEDPDEPTPSVRCSVVLNCI